MKKFFSLIALVGVFAACQPEDLTTAFSVSDAKLTITANAKSLAPEFDKNKDKVTWNADAANKTDASVNTEKQYVVTLVGTPVLTNGTATITATYEGASNSVKVDYPTMLAGAVGNITTDVFIPYNSGEYEISVEEAEAESEYTVKMLQEAAHGHGVATKTVEFDDEEYEIPMLENANEFVLNDSYKFVTYEGTDLQGEPKILNKDFADDVNGIALLYDEGITEKEETKPFSVSAWAIYNVLNVVEEVKTVYNVVATPKAGANVPELPENGVVGTFTAVKKNSAAQVFEFAHPNHASHYVAPEDGHYHGHGHGDGNNAGGGLVIAE